MDGITGSAGINRIDSTNDSVDPKILLSCPSDFLGSNLAAASIVDSRGCLGKGWRLAAALHFAEDIGGCGAAVDRFLLLARRQLARLFFLGGGGLSAFQELPDAAAFFLT